MTQPDCLEDLVAIPALEFVQGGPVLATPGEEYISTPEERVTTDPFRVTRDLVSRLDYLVYARSEGLEVGWLEEAPTTGPAGNLPCTGLTLVEAQQFCAFYGGRLLTESEWEAAFRGPDRWVLPEDIGTGETIWDAWFEADVRVRESLPAGFFGVRGGFWTVDEWTSSSVDGMSVVKGTPWMMKRTSLARRYLLRPTDRWFCTGFRVAFSD